MKLLSQSYLAFPGKCGSVTLTEIPPSFEFAENEGEDGVSLDQTAAGEKWKKALKNILLYIYLSVLTLEENDEVTFMFLSHTQRDL